LIYFCILRLLTADTKDLTYSKSHHDKKRAEPKLPMKAAKSPPR
jgi:hypothetical protein